MDGKTTKNKKRDSPQINADLQIPILKLISQEELSIKKTAEKLGRKDSSSVKKAMEILERRKQIDEIDSIILQDGEDPTFRPTELGIKFALKFYSPAEFWKMCFYVFDQKNNSKLKLDLNPKEIFDRYEKFILNITKDNYTPSYFIRNLNELKELSLNKEIFFLNIQEDVPILDSLGLKRSSTLSEIYVDLKERYRKIYDHFTCVKCKKKYPELHRIIHKDVDLLESKLKRLIQDNYIYEIETNGLKKYSLLHSGLLLLLYYLFRDLDKTESLSLEHLRKGIEDRTLTQGQKALRFRIPLILKNYEKLLPAIFSKESRNFLGINDYYILYIVIIMYFETHRGFLFKIDIPHYHFLTVCRDLMEKKFQNNLIRYHDTGMNVLKSLIDNRKTTSSFCSDISEEYFNQRKIKAEKILKNIRKKYKRPPNYNEKSNNIQDDQIDFSNWIILEAALFSKLREENIPKRKLTKADKQLPKGKDRESFKRVLPVLKELGKFGNPSTGYPQISYYKIIGKDDFIQIQNKITFDFFLLYSHLEKEKWKENFARLPIKKWYLEKIQRIVDFSETSQHEILKEIKEN